jgi:hypothetical protein
VQQHLIRRLIAGQCVDLPEGPYIGLASGTVHSFCTTKFLRDEMAFTGLHWADRPSCRSTLYRGRRLVRLSDLLLSVGALIDGGRRDHLATFDPAKDGAPW